MPTFTGINHLAMATGDMDATIRFWRDLLGMRLVAGLGRPGYRHYFFEISDTDMIAFFEWEGVEPLEPKDHGAPVQGKRAFDHVAVGVGSDDDLWELKARLEAASIWVSEVISHGFLHSLYTFDPNNIPVEFSAPVPGQNVRADPVMGDREPTTEARKGADPVPGTWPEPEPVPDEDKAVYPGEGMELFDKD